MEYVDDLVTSIYNLLEYSDNYSMASNYYKDEVNNNKTTTSKPS